MPNDNRLQPEAGGVSSAQAEAACYTDAELSLALAADLAEYKRTVMRAHESGKCVACGELAAPRIYSPAGRAEYQISGMCEVCFDNMLQERME